MTAHQEKNDEKPRLLLLNPPPPRVNIRAPAVATVAGRMPPMGLLALASFARARGFADVQLVDLQAAADPRAVAVRAAEAFHPHVIGVTCCLFTFHDAVSVARAVRAAAPGAAIIFGGHHVSVFPAETAGLPECDAAVFGEGEATLRELMESVARGEGVAGMPGVAARDENGAVIVGEPRPLIEDIDSLPFPDRSLLHREGYNWVLDRGRRVALLFAGRGCPFHCSFCFNVMHSVRFHSPDYVVEDMNRCAAQGYTMLNFYDETFNLGRARTLELAEAIGSRGPGLPWTFRGRCDVMDGDIARALARAGCAHINFGIEAGTDDILKVYRKQINVDTVRRAVAAAARAGIEPVGYFILGAPHETGEQCRATIRLARELPLDFAQFMILIPLPGTEIYNRALAEGGFDCDYLRAWAARPERPLDLKLWNTGLSEPQLVAFMRQAYRGFYLRPAYILRQLMKIRSWKDLRARAAAALSIFKYSLFRK
jgi:radical SAM superfamily enzyme YgiQ (UPF0313 family)